MRRLLLGIYGFSFFNKFLLLTPVYAIFMQQNGLSDIQLSTMFIISTLGTLAAQIPITWIIKHLGQRWTMVLGQFLKIVAILLWLVAPNYAGFATGMVLWGVQAGFRSVAFEGLMYDQIRAHGATRSYSKILGRKYTYESIGVVLSAFGSLLMFMGYEWVTWASVISVLLSILCLIMIHLAPAVEHVQTKSVSSMRIIRTGIRAVLRMPCVLSIMLLSVLVANVPYLDDFLSPIGLQLGISTEYVGIVSIFLLGCATLGQRFAYKLTRISDKLLYALIGVIGVGYIVFGGVYTFGALWILGGAYLLSYGINVLLYARFQHMIPSYYRSVMLSLYTTLAYLTYMAVCGVIGLGGMLGSWRFSIVILGVLMLLICGWALMRVRNKCPLND